MVRELWVRPTGNTKQVATAALEAGVDGLVVTQDQRATVEGLGRLQLAELEDQGIEFPGGQGRIVPIGSPEDQEAARSLIGKVDVLVVAAEDWTIIPLENLIAWTQGTSTRLFAQVPDADAADVALGTLETGVEGLVLTTDDPAAVRETAAKLSPETGSLELVEGEVLSVEDAGMGDRVCVDTTSLLSPEEGLLVGSSSAFMVLVASEAQDSGYVAARPFRVNAGAVHAYVQGAGGETAYLSEVQAGKRLVVVDRDGGTRVVTTGRAKIERRPLLVVQVVAGGQKGNIVVQNAETIRLMTPEGPKSVSRIQAGDRVLVHLGHAGGRHFGQAIEETVEER